MSGQEHVQPSSEPDAAVATGSGADRSETGRPPVPPEKSAGTTGIGTQADQQAPDGPPPGNAPYDLAPEEPDPKDTTPRSPSGT